MLLHTLASFIALRRVSMTPSPAILTWLAAFAVRLVAGQGPACLTPALVAACNPRLGLVKLVKTGQPVLTNAWF